ncbi:MAG TPA: FAD-dependent oxidoreductase [Casimicrobiaceae bacterium]
MITAQQLQATPLLADVPEHELAVLASRAADVYLRRGDWLIQEGEVPAFFIVLSGRITVSKLVGGIERVINTYRSGDYMGEVPLLLGSPALASLRADEPTRVARLDPSDFHELIASCSSLNAQIMRTMATRVGYLQQMAVETPIATVKLIGHRFDLACHALRDFLARNRVSFRWHDIQDPEARAGLAAAPDPSEAYPVVVLPDGTRLTTPSFRTVAERLGLQTRPSDGRYDVAIVGAGPAGLAAAVYGASEGLRTILIERHAPGGQAGTSSRIENYLGFPTGIAGDDLGNRALQQAKRFGAEIVVARDVVGMAADPRDATRALILDGDNRIDARTIVIANGVSWRKLEIVGAEALVGRGIYYGAARTEAAGTRGLDIFLIGGGNSAGQAAMFFADYARTVTILIRAPSLATSMSHYLIAQLATKSNVTIEANSRVVGLEGDDHLDVIVLEDRRSGVRSRAQTQALFVFIGADADTAWLPPAVIRDERGYVCTGRDVVDLVERRQGTWPLARDPYLLETSVPGIFAAGDVRHGSIKRVASGVGEGSMAIAFIHQYLVELEERQTALTGHDARSASRAN